MGDDSASVFCFTPLRVPVSELGRLAACPPTQPTSTAPACSAPPLPQGPCPVCPRLEQEFEPCRQAAYWKAMHRSCPRSRGPTQGGGRPAPGPAPTARAATLRAQDRDGRGDRSLASDGSPADTPPPRPRGQQRGQPGPRRRDHSHLPAVPEDHVLAPRPVPMRRGAVSPSPTSRAPRIPTSLRSRSEPIAASSVGVVIGPPAPVVLIPASSPPRRRLG